MPDLSAYPKLAAGFMALFPTAPVTRLLSGLIAQELYLRAGRWHRLRTRATLVPQKVSSLHCGWKNLHKMEVTMGKRISLNVQLPPMLSLRKTGDSDARPDQTFDPQQDAEGLRSGSLLVLGGGCGWVAGKPPADKSAG